MRFTNGSFNYWSWIRNADVSADGKKDATAVAPEQPHVSQLLLRQHLTRPRLREPLCARQEAQGEGRREGGAG